MSVFFDSESDRKIIIRLMGHRAWLTQAKLCANNWNGRYWARSSIHLVDLAQISLFARDSGKRLTGPNQCEKQCQKTRTEMEERGQVSARKKTLLLIWNNFHLHWQIRYQIKF
jgi:hypothetical protein